MADYQASALSGCNQLLIHASFGAQAPSAWRYDWASAWCNTPLSPPAIPPSPPPPLPPPPPPSPPSPPFQPGAAFRDRNSLTRALGEWCTNPTDATAKYSHISAWDVRAVLNMAELFGTQQPGRGDSSYEDYSYGHFADIHPCHTRWSEDALGFNEDINAWDVGQVTTMHVSCRLVDIGGLIESTRRVRGCAEDVLSSKRLQPALGCVGRWPSHNHACAPPPASCSGKYLTASTNKRRVCACWRDAGNVRTRVGFQPACSCVGCWQGRRHGGASPPAF